MGVGLLCLPACFGGGASSPQIQNLPLQTVRVEGRQFAWDITQAGPDGLLDTADDRKLINRIVVPAGSRVALELSSRDVLHGFWIPRLGLRQTLIPRATLKKEVAVSRPGNYKIACSEICGNGHAQMVGWLTALSPEDYNNWLRQPHGEPIRDLRDEGVEK